MTSRKTLHEEDYIKAFNIDLSNVSLREDGDVLTNISMMGWYEHGGHDFNLHLSKKIDSNLGCISGRYNDILGSTNFESYSIYDRQYVKISGNLLRYWYIEDPETGNIGIVSQNSCDGPFVIKPSNIDYAEAP